MLFLSASFFPFPIEYHQKVAHLKVSLTYHIPDCLANVHHLTPFLYPHGYPTGFLATVVSPAHSCSVTLSSSSLQLLGLQHTRLPCPSPSPGVCSNSCPLSQCHPTISSSVAPLSFCLQSFPASESFPMNGFFASGGQSIRVSASASALPVNIQG